MSTIDHSLARSQIILLSYIPQARRRREHFLVRLNLAVTDAIALRKRTHLSSRTPFRIFVVDDEPVIAATLSAILNMNGFSAKCFTKPLDALAALKSDTPDLLISDVSMPGLSGVELAIQMRGLCPSCKILLFSGQAATVDLLANARSQGHDFMLLLKPVHPAIMLSNILAIAADTLQGDVAC